MGATASEAAARVAEGAAPASRRTLVTAATAATVLLVLGSLATWALFPSDRETATEAYVYHRFASEVRDGAVPYRDVTVEYPPGAIPVFLAPLGGFGIFGSTDGATWDEAAVNQAARNYEEAFAALMTLLLAATIWVVAWTLSGLRATGPHAWLALSAVGAAPLMLGALPLIRFEAWPVLLTSLALLAAVRDRHGLAGLALGFAAGTKLYPLVLAPVLLTRSWRAGGRPAAVRTALGVLGGLAVVVGPFLALAPGETLDALRLQVGRALQLESLLASVAVAIHAAGVQLEQAGLPLEPLPLETCSRCNGLVAAQLTGGLGTGLAMLSSLVTVALLAAASFAVARRGSGREDLVRWAAFSVVALVAVGRVLSAQFVLWPLPLVVLVAGLRGRVATGLLVATLVLTNVWFPTLYREYVNGLGVGPTAFLVLRNGLLLALLVVLGASGSRLRRTPD